MYLYRCDCACMRPCLWTIDADADFSVFSVSTFKVRNQAVVGVSV